MNVKQLKKLNAVMFVLTYSYQEGITKPLIKEHGLLRDNILFTGVDHYISIDPPEYAYADNRTHSFFFDRGLHLDTVFDRSETLSTIIEPDSGKLTAYGFCTKERLDDVTTEFRKEVAAFIPKQITAMQKAIEKHQSHLSALITS